MPRLEAIARALGTFKLESRPPGRLQVGGGRSASPQTTMH